MPAWTEEASFPPPAAPRPAAAETLSISGVPWVTVFLLLAAFWILTGERRGALETLRHEQVVERLTLLVRVLLAAPEDAWARLIAASEPVGARRGRASR